VITKKTIPSNKKTYTKAMSMCMAFTQSKLTYDAKPELEVKANAIREKLFKGKAINQGN